MNYLQRNVLSDVTVSANILTVTKGIIVQQVNCQGVMGSGLALSIKTAYPVVYTRYKGVCNSTPPHSLLGRVQMVEVADGLWVANIFSQLNYGRDKSVTYTDYSALHNGLSKIKSFALKHFTIVAIPYNIGCGLANGDWDLVSNIINDTLSDVAYKVYKL